MVAVFILIALFPGWFAPFAPDALVGSRFMAPGEQAALPVLIVPANSTVNNLKDLAVPLGSATAGCRRRAGRADGRCFERAGPGDRQPDQKSDPQVYACAHRSIRYRTVEEALQAVADGTDVAAVILTSEWVGARQAVPRIT